MPRTAIVLFAALASAGASCLGGACQDTSTTEDAAVASAMLQVKKSDPVQLSQVSVGSRAQDLGNDLKNFAQQTPDNGAEAAKDWWDTNASETMQHLDEDFVESKKDDWRAAFLPNFTWKGKRVLDYGIGAGYLGEELFKNYSIGRYMGVDISQNSIDGAARVLKPWAEKVQLLLTPQNFSALRPQIFVSQQVIQHFPTIEYFEEFLSNVDSCGASALMLHFRKSSSGTTHVNNAYTNSTPGNSKLFALLTSDEFIAERLPHYKLLWNSSRPMCCGTEGEYTGWKLKAKVSKPPIAGSGKLDTRMSPPLEPANPGPGSPAISATP